MKYTRFSLRTLCLLTVLAALVIQYARPIRETRLAAKLQAPCQVPWKSKPLNEALAELAEQHGIRIHVDPHGLNEEGVAPNSPVSIDLAQPLRLKTALAILLEPLNLGIEIRTDPWHGQYLVVSSQLLLDKELHTESFDVADLRAHPEELEFADARASALLRKDLVQLLYDSVEPQSWEHNGGRCKLMWTMPGRTLQVTQTRRALFDVHDLVCQLRRMREKAAARAYLARLICSGHTPGIWKVCRLAPGARDEWDARKRTAAQEAAVGSDLAARIDAVVHDPHQLCVVEDMLEGLYGEPLPPCFRLCCETADARVDVLLDDRSSSNDGVRIYLRDDRVVELGLTHVAAVELRKVCEQALE